ncbi:very short patch repair endonuclease [Alisedimentitalea sp. MJ-SS2]|uniref:very short patch repair endonuclease n=1 Tax=Aliisedimentitalea sp. MJ-SS2 TaxID=3049795 RepID=UPI00290C58DC|nr:very short patch repair endonuclease [Alisedimentitalea sp. MJ-SS2]MDU8927682.1 very short patch repair endonuclease [Alisedimentitalea sp. MJ-SS2]
MAAIRSKDTKPEKLIRCGLHALGFRFRLHQRSIPGTPDIVLPKYNALIDVRSCFFHGHDCRLFKLPETRREAWRHKIETNRSRDSNNLELQKELGWRVAIIWECSIRGPQRLEEKAVFDSISQWLLSSEEILELRGST